MNLKSFTLSNLKRKKKIYWDRFRGLDFITIIQPEEVGLNSRNAYRSSPSGYKYLEELLINFKISSDDSIIDIGCGKGSAIRTMLKFPFAQVDGIELSEKIAAIATWNFKKLGSNRTNIFVGNALNQKNYDSYNFVYFFNPFPANVMEVVIKALIQSINKFDREIIIIYNNPTCHDEVVKQGIFKKIGTYYNPHKWGNKIYIYSNKGSRTSCLTEDKFIKLSK